MLGAFAVALVGSATAGFVALVAIAALHLTWLRKPPVPAKVLGMRQMGLGLVLGVRDRGRICAHMKEGSK